MTKTSLNTKRETLQEKPKKERSETDFLGYGQFIVVSLLVTFLTFLRLQAFALCENEFTFKIVQSHELEIITLAYLSSLEVT